MKTTAPGGSNLEPDTYVSVNEACRRFGFSRRSFYRWLALPSTGLAGVVVRVPPPAGRIRVPVRRFEHWLRGVDPRGTSPEPLGESADRRGGQTPRRP